MKAVHVIKREYMENVKKKSFIISTILVPVFLVAVTFVPLLSTLFMPSTQVSLFVLDRSGEIAGDFITAIADTLEDGRPKYVVPDLGEMSDDSEEAKARLVGLIEADELDVVVDIPEDISSSDKVFYYTKNVGNVRIIERFETALNRIILRKRLDHAGIDYEQVKDLTKSVSLEMRRVTKAGAVEKKDFLGEWAMVFIFTMILYVTLLTWGISIQRSLIEEKGSRVIEVLLSSLEPKDLFFGKIFGLGAVGLTQLGIWTMTMLALSAYVQFVAVRYSEYLSVSPLIIVYFIIFFVLGFLFYSAVFAIVGAICSTEQEAQQLQGLVTLPLIVPILVLMIIIQSPNSMPSVVLSLIPLFSPMLMLGRIVIAMPDFWQIALSILILLVSIYGVVHFSARVFRVGILMTGKRPGLNEIVRWYRYS